MFQNCRSFSIRSCRPTLHAKLSGTNPDIGVVRNYVPRTLVPPKPFTPYSRNQVPRILNIMYYVPQARNYVPSALDIMYYHHK